MFTYYQCQVGKNRKKFLIIKMNAEEKTVFAFDKDFLCSKKIQQFIIVDSEFQVIDDKKKLCRENQWKRIVLEKAFLFS